MPTAVQKRVQEEFIVRDSVTYAALVKYVDNWKALPDGVVFDVADMDTEAILGAVDEVIAEMGALKARIRSLARPYEPKAVHDQAQEELDTAFLNGKQ